MRAALALLCSLLLAGCPGPPPGGGTSGAGSRSSTKATPPHAGTSGANQGESQEPVPAERSRSTDAANDAPAGADPLAGSVFTREQLFAIYAAEARGGAEAERVLREQRLVDANGNPIPARQAAYERALRRYAEADPAGWSAFLETLPP